ncbi:hypothetical protein [Kitasatospora sp. NPDC058046]|uniref:hypothetical protein n=1 Tax=Kitasatospora sp. NPDC058046 TaxID=3346312 RepID=UPI0036DFA1A0
MITLGALVVVLIVGIALLPGGKGGTNAASGSAPAAAGAGAGGQSLSGSGTGGRPAGLRLVDGVPIGYTNSREGAVAAAVNYELARSSVAYLTDGQVRERILKAIMTSEAAPSQLKEDNDAAAKLASAFGLTVEGSGQLIARASPLGSRVASYSPQVATVSVWMCGVVGVASANAPLPVSASWSTYTLVLIWQNGDWKVSSITAANGPTPLQTTGQKPTPVDVFSSTNRDFDAPPYVG